MTKVNILLVDDVPENLTALEAILGQLDLNFIKATSGRQALRYLLEHDFAVILLDIHMPELDGIETAKLIRYRENSKNTPIIFLTAYETDDLDVLRAYSMGGIDFIMKPIIPEILLHKIEVLINLFNHMQRLEEINLELAEKLEIIQQLNHQLETAHEALKRSSTEVFKLNERLNITLRSIGDAVIATDADARILLVNDVAQRLTGWTQAEAMGQPLATVFNIINEYTREVVESPAERVLREGVVVGLANHTLLIAKDGREVPIDDSGAPIRESDGTIAGVVLVFRDITERKQGEEQEREMITVMERQHLARELHDSVTQSMFASTSLAELIPRIWEQDPQAAMGHLRQVVTINRGAMAEMRALLLELRPDAILNNSLRDLYQQLIDAAPARTEIDAKLIVIGEDRPLPPETHLALYRIAQESVNNILKHSRANSFRIELIYTEDAVTVTIEDDGQGFVTNETLGGLGLGSMRERAESIGASLELVSQLSQGTTVTIRWVNSSA